MDNAACQNDQNNAVANSNAARGNTTTSNTASNNDAAVLPMPGELPPSYDSLPPGSYPGNAGYPGATPYPGGYPGGVVYQQGYPGQPVQMQPQQQQVQVVTVVPSGNCPHCQVGYVTQEFSVAGILLAIFCFPCGIFFCLMMTGRRCTNCNRRF